jgi:membrane fusion protein (multidrug efflux system)
MGPSSSFVYVVGADGRVEARTVAVSAWHERGWVVDSGLAAGERVIVDGVQKVRPGAVVQPVPAADEAGR